MSQEDSVLHVSPDRKSVLIPCGCGDDSDRLRLGTFDDKDPYPSMFISASFAAHRSLRGRLGAAWRALIGRPHEDSEIISVATAKDLRDWLTEKIDGFQSLTAGSPNERTGPQEPPAPAP